MFFVRPVNDEKKLREIEKIQLKDLRPEFTNTLQEFRDLLKNNIKPKRYHNKLLSGSMFINLIEEILNQFNNKEIPEIDSTMERVVSLEKRNLLDKIKQKTEEYIKKSIEDNSNILKDGVIYVSE